MIDLEVLYSYKSQIKEQSAEIKKLLSVYGQQSNIKKNNNNILNDKKIQSNKDKIENKVLMILNKLSDINMENILIEFFKNVGFITSEEYNLVQKIFFNKILEDINFVDTYLKFINIIMYIYNKQYNNAVFFNLIENEYNNMEKDEEERKKILIIIRKLVQYKMLSEKIIDEINISIFNRKNIDIYNWFNGYNIDNNTVIKIKKITTDDMRDKLLLENLVNNIEVDIIELEIINAIDMKEDMDLFIKTKCVDGVMKNKFVKILIEKYIKEGMDIFSIINDLLTNKILTKNNIIKGVLLNEKILNKSEKSEKLLQYMKDNDMTTSLEKLIKKYC